MVASSEGETKGRSEIAEAERRGEHWIALAWFNVRGTELRTQLWLLSELGVGRF